MTGSERSRTLASISLVIGAMSLSVAVFLWSQEEYAAGAFNLFAAVWNLGMFYVNVRGR